MAVAQYYNCTKHLLRARHCYTCLTPVNSPNPLNRSPVRFDGDPWLHGIPGTGMMESSSIPGIQEPSPAVHRVSLEAENKLPGLAPARVTGSHVCSCPCPDTIR